MVTGKRLCDGVFLRQFSRCATLLTQRALDFFLYQKPLGEKLQIACLAGGRVRRRPARDIRFERFLRSYRTISASYLKYRHCFTVKEE